jgi:nucleotide-binding universal stress UspA family protein
MPVNGAFHLAIDQQDRIWITSAIGDAVTRFRASPPSKEVFPTGSHSGKGLAIDSQGNAWITNTLGTGLDLRTKAKLLELKLTNKNCLEAGSGSNIALPPNIKAPQYARGELRKGDALTQIKAARGPNHMIQVRRLKRKRSSGEVRMYRNILIATDGSELAEKAVDHGVAMAEAINAKVTVVTVSEPFRVLAVESHIVSDTRETYERHVAARATECLAAAKQAASIAGVTCETVQVECPHPYQGIIDTATQKGCDLIVMASHGGRGISAVVLGSETVKVMTHSAIPVLVVRPSSRGASLGQEKPSTRAAAA